MHATTILSVRKGNQVTMGGDGQVTMNNTVMKARANKIRRLDEGQVIVGFAGATADAFTLFEKFEGKLKDSPGNLPKAAVELAKEWRTDRVLRHLEALLAVAGPQESLLISGNGDVLQPDDDVMSIGSGSGYALAAARAMTRHSDLSAEEITRQALLIAADICVFTNDQLHIETLNLDELHEME